MADYAALKTLLATPPYNTQTDAQNATAINALTVSVLTALSPAAAKIALMRTGDWGWLAGVAAGWVTSANANGAGAVAVATTAPWTTRRTAQTFVDMFTDSPSLDMTLQANVDAMTAGLNILVSANVVTAASRTALGALATITVPWPKVHGFWNTDTNTTNLDIGEIAAAKVWV